MRANIMSIILFTIINDFDNIYQKDIIICFLEKEELKLQDFL